VGAAELLVILSIVAAVLCPVAVVFAALGAILAAPLLYRGTLASWTDGTTPLEAYEVLGDGATTGAFMVRPCSFLVEGNLSSGAAPAEVVAHLAEQFSTGWGRQLFTRDDTGVVGEIRFIHFLATDMGWIAAVVVDPADGGGSTVHYRFRTTYMLPVITFFLTMRLRMHVLTKLVP
jgi:hypothetical protein